MRFLDLEASRPRIRLLAATELPLSVEPVALLAPLGGTVVVASSAGEQSRLGRGELLVLRGGPALRMEPGGDALRLGLFEASPAWLRAFLALHGEEGADERPALERIPESSSVARRAGQVFAELRPGRHVSLVACAALVELISRANGPEAEPAPTRSAERRELLRGTLDGYDPGSEASLSLRGLAARLGLSERQAARLVRAETGRSFRELKARARLERALELLASSDLPILEVALRAGWNSASQFHEAFRSSVGVSPTRYRAERRG